MLRCWEGVARPELPQQRRGCLKGPHLAVTAAGQGSVFAVAAERDLDLGGGARTGSARTQTRWCRAIR
jgi:hypothetical protein